MKYLFAILFIVALVIILPFCTLWSLNTLFPALAIPYTIETWVATVFLTTGIFGKNVKLVK